VWAVRFLFGKKVKKNAGADLFYYEMNKLNKIGGKCFFLGSSQDTLDKIVSKSKIEFSKVKVEVFSPPFKAAFSEEENTEMIAKVNASNPDILFIGMTAPKQEKSAYTQFKNLNTGHICSIGAVFYFYAGKIVRAPEWMIKIGLEWLYRLLKEPKRMWKRYLIGNTTFIYAMLQEKLRD
jgi:N-acetylglucosaminyldiphosphoundecaprenol N-acetyl-beta-D-mannosaminyltransferase